MEFVVIAICLGVIPGIIAQSKGRNFVAWWLYGAALFVVALPHSIIVSKDAKGIEQKQLSCGGSKKCPFCAEIIKSEARVCRFCGRDLPAPELAQVHQVIAKEQDPPIDEEELDRRFKEWQIKRRK